ncbi:MAG: OB-fold nucleic acid binding domain-containing protein, partial [Planctomycetota bacterium]
MSRVTVRHLNEHEGETVTVRGWLSNKRRSGKIAFLQVRDGSGTVQTVVSRNDVSEEAWEDVKRVTQESTVRLTGIARLDER